MDFIKNILGLILLPIVAALFVILFPFLVIIAYINYKIGEKNERFNSKAMRQL